MVSVMIDRRAGLSSATAMKGPCRAATTANVTLAGLQTIDGVSLVAGDRVLVKDQTNATDNGIRIVDTGDWARAKDFSRNDDVVKGTRVAITDGTVNASGTWQVDTESPITFDTDDIDFVFVERVDPADIINMTEASALTGAELVHVVQSSNNRKTTVGDILEALDQKPAATAGISAGFSLSTSGAVVQGNVFSPNVRDYGAAGDGAANDATAFNSAKATNKLVLIPKPPTAYNFSTPVTTGGNAWFPDPSTPWSELTDGGNLNLWRGRATDLTPGANIWRLSDRLFVGYAASAFAGNTIISDEGTSWLGDEATAPMYLAVNAGVLWMSGLGDPSLEAYNQPYGFVAGVKTSTNGRIGFGSAVVADEAATAAWCFIAEIQRESGSGSVYGIEFAAKNKGNNAVMTPNAQVSGVFGVWAAGGGDNAFGGNSANPSTAAMVVLKNSNTWNSGIIFMKDALTNGEAIAMSSEGVGGAHGAHWYNAAGNQVFTVQSTATDAVSWLLQRTNAGLLVGAASRTLFSVADNTSGVNYLTVVGGPTGSGGLLRSDGSDTNSSVRVRGKGTGGVHLQDGAQANKVSVDTTGISFFAAGTAAKQTVTGSRGGNAALASLLTALAAYGLLTDSSSA